MSRESLALLAVFALPFLMTGLSAQQVAAEGVPINIDFEFSPALSSYEPGHNFTVNFTALNPTSGQTTERVLNVSAHFGWMAPNIYEWKNVSSTSSWLQPNGANMETYSLLIHIPADAAEQTYSYFFAVVYEVNYTLFNPPLILIQEPAWGVGTVYHDFVVSKSTTSPPESPNYVPYLAVGALIVAIGAIGAVVYHSRRARPEAVGMAMAGAQGIGDSSASHQGTPSYPIIRASPGERFPVEKGFIYLVKEKRPNISFTMFNEATSHGAKGMLVVREHPNRLKQMHQFEAAKILWLTRRVGMDHIDPTELSLLNLEMTKFVESMPKSVVLLEGLEYVITQNDFESVLRFINHLHDFVLAHDCAVIVAIDPRVLSTRELALLERSARIVEPAGREEMSSDTHTEEIVAK